MKILILSRNATLYSTQSLQRAAERRGHQVQIIDHLLCSLIVERDRPGLFIGFDPLNGIDAVIPRIGASATEYGAAVIRQLEWMGVFTTVSSASLMQARNKLHCMQFLSRHDIDVPKTGISAGDTCAGMVYDQITRDKAVVKLLASTQGLGVMLAQTRSQGLSMVEGFHRVGADVLIQEFIQDAKGSDIRAFVVDGKVEGAMLRQALPGEFRSNIHRGASARSIELSDEELFLAIRSAELLGLSVAGVDILRSSRGPLVLEVNASPGLEGIETATGNDIAGKIIEYIERAKSEQTTPDKGKTVHTV
ncbi:MAG: RimK family alpha-L-glutamate ligase [Saprospiraceae bacterium]|jgi:ribosomal protein S6--L-glutamate ligase|nr:RimK family alpha-L-glutamate ligase [Saprospiraceae bacterium]MBP9210914.1 RimK family alpha-L-glutamate ligase [Saprospiraceae bacterium]MBV6473951.1 Ribosomal protein S6--L-glutamate ligase [Saprospiraceae bacterium]